MARIKEMDLTSGSIFKKLFIYALPFIFTNILQINYGFTNKKEAFYKHFTKLQIIQIAL